MLFINPQANTKSAKDYFTEHLSKSDYYMRDAQEVLGSWHGRGAELMGLHGQVDKKSYFRLCENVNPVTGEQLTPRLRCAPAQADKQPAPLVPVAGPPHLQFGVARRARPVA